MIMRKQVENLPRMDASLIRWSGLLDLEWTSSGEEPATEPAAWLALRTQSDATYRPNEAPWATFRVIASAPKYDPQSGALSLGVTLTADRARAFGTPGATWTTNLQFASNSTNLGGKRWWLRCPVCSHRRAHLYPVAPYHPWACRECLGLTYRSRQELGHSARHGNAMGSLHYALNNALRRVARTARRSARRAYHRRH